MEHINRIEMHLRSLKRKMSATEKDESNLDFAIHQLTGYTYRNGSITNLIMGMALTKEEWVKLKRNDLVNFLSKEDFNEIDNFFNY